MSPSRLRPAIYWSLVVVTLFNALSAVAGGIAMLATDGLGMPSSFLASGPFTSFTVPAVILLVIVGGSQTLASVLLLARRDSALLWSSVAGFGILIWIFTETALINGISWLQVLYFATGIIQLALVLALLGVAGWLPRASMIGGRQ